MIVRLLLILSLMVAAGCGSDEPAGDDIPNPVTGLIVEVGTDYIVLRGDDGNRYRFDNGDTTITRDHLLVHQKQKLPVKVTHEPNGDRRLANSIVDAT